MVGWSVGVGVKEGVVWDGDDDEERWAKEGREEEDQKRKGNAANTSSGEAREIEDVGRTPCTPPPEFGRELSDGTSYQGPPNARERTGRCQPSYCSCHSLLSLMF